MPGTSERIAELREWFLISNVRAFSRVVRFGESNQDDSAYWTLFGGERFTSIRDHPRIKVTKSGYTSTAAGAYQALAGTWDDFCKYVGKVEFTPEMQDLFFVWCVNRRKALQDVINGDLGAALNKCSWEWASLPPSRYKQPTRSVEECRRIFVKYGGKPADDIPVSVEKPAVAPIIFPLLELAAKFIPQLAEKFSSGSEVANRNMAAGKVIADAIVEATNSPNLQAAVEKMESDPQAVASANAAVAEVWPSIFEAGGGGIDGARKAMAAPDQVPLWKNPAVIIAILLIPLIYMVAVAVLFGVGGQTWSDEIKAMVVTAFVAGLLGSITGFFLGSSLGSQKKDALMGGR